MPPSNNSRVQRRSRNSFVSKPARPRSSSVRHMTSHVLPMDLTSALTFWLHHNIFIGTDSLHSERLEALTRVLNSLQRFAGERCPSNDLSRVADALQFLQEYLVSSETVSKSEWLTLLTRSGLRSSVTWSSQCRSSSSPFTCGLWLLFHSLAAHAAEDGSRNCEAIVTLVQMLFGCDACRDHFLTMTPTHTNLSRVEGMMWLWRTHNAVNLRLDSNERAATDSSTKTQRPTSIECPDCTEEGGWNLNRVAEWLLETYGPTCSR